MGAEKITAEILEKLREAISIDASVKEACFYARISEEDYEDFIKKNPEIEKEFYLLRAKQILKARQAIIESLKNPRYAQWYLERKMREEFDLETQRKEKEEMAELNRGLWRVLRGNEPNPYDAKNNPSVQPSSGAKANN